MNAQQVAEQLRHVYDPDLGLSIVALGLVYGITVDRDNIALELTMTSPGCPFSSVIVDSARAAALATDGASSVEVTIATEPSWDPRMMELAARAALGLR